MKITSKGQVTIPLIQRKRHGLLPNTHVEFVSDGRTLKLVKVEKATGKGRQLIERMAGSGNGKWTTEQIMKLMRG
jgi:bifunctional DNA-binding transcriptional regulator/antitoxin component of YhaV-PrlF toxin-antitoxin module